MKRFVGVDYGTKRVGLAISDGLGLTARPLEVISRSDAVARLGSLRDEYDFDVVVVGMPTSLGGKNTASAEGAVQLGSEIESALNVKVEYVDEKFTSRMANEALLESGMKRRERKETVDRVAAAIILQTYLDRRSGNSASFDDVEPPELP